MSNFHFKALNRDNQAVNGSVEAASIDEAKAALAERGFNVTSINSGAMDIKIDLGFIQRVTLKDLALFSRQFSVMISASVAMTVALHILAENLVNSKLKLAISKVAGKVEGGSRLSDALELHPNIFSHFYVSVIRSGEKSGRLDESLNYLSDELEKDYDISSKIKGAMIYPAVVVTGMLIVGVAMMIFVVPQLTSVFEQSNVELPLATQILIAVSNFMVGYWWALIIGTIFLAFGIRTYVKNPLGKKQVDFLLLRMPIFGNLFQKVYLVRFTRSMSTLLTSGVTVVDSLKAAANVVNNQTYKDLIEKTVLEVEGGNSISSVFLKSSEIPNMVSQMLLIGEKTGKLDLVLDRVTAFYTREVDTLLATLMTLMEPIIIVIMGVAVGGMAAAIILPMYNLASSY